MTRSPAQSGCGTPDGKTWPPPEQARLERGLARATKGDRSAPVVIFCRSDCWMSWNAARRAVALGYAGVHWFPGGIEEWQDAGGAPLVTAQPVAP